MYDGIHYDPLVWEIGGVAPEQGIFPVEDEAVVMDALQIARKAHKVTILPCREGGREGGALSNGPSPH